MLVSILFSSLLGASLVTAYPTKAEPEGELVYVKLEARNSSETTERHCANYESGVQWIPVYSTKIDDSNYHWGYQEGVIQGCTDLNANDQIREQIFSGQDTLVEVHNINNNGIQGPIWLSDDIAGYLTVRVQMTKGRVEWGFEQCRDRLLTAFTIYSDCSGKERQDTIGGLVVDGEGVTYTVQAFKEVST